MSVPPRGFGLRCSYTIDTHNIGFHSNHTGQENPIRGQAPIPTKADIMSVPNCSRRYIISILPGVQTHVPNSGLAKPFVVSCSPRKPIPSVQSMRVLVPRLPTADSSAAKNELRSELFQGIPTSKWKDTPEDTTVNGALWLDYNPISPR